MNVQNGWGRIVDWLQGERARLDAEITRLRAENERLEKHKRAQAEDIMTLVQLVGKLEAEVDKSSIRVSLTDLPKR